MSGADVTGASPLAPDWLQLPWDLNALHAPSWAHDVERSGTGELTVGGVTVRALKEQFGTPLFVLSEGDFRARARAFRDAFNEAFADLCGGVDVYYAGKAFLSVEVARWVRQEGLRLDTCSGGELAVAQRAGFPGELLGLHGNNKSAAEINRALDMNLGRIVVDSIDELERVAGIVQRRRAEVSQAEATQDKDAQEPGHEVTAKVMLRLTPGVHAHTHEFIATAHEDQKFGLSMAPGTAEDAELRGIDPALSAAEQAVDAAVALDGIELLGLHCHIGSQIFEADGFAVAARKLLGFHDAMQRKHGIVLPEMDLGGGHGIAYTPVDTPRPVAEIAQALAGVVRETCRDLAIECPRISIEPGRAIVGSTTFTLYEVGTRKTVQVEAPDDTERTYPRRYVSVDGGMSDNARPVLYDADYSAALASRSSDAPAQLSRVVGKHCESGDIVVKDVYLPSDVSAGDLLAVPGTGAYCWALASNYNYLARPGVVAVSDGTARWIIRGETEEDLLNRDMGAGQL